MSNAVDSITASNATGSPADAANGWDSIWNTVEWVLLDMDGTLLDLHYDNRFWRQHLPRRLTELTDLDHAAATGLVQRIHDETHGTLEWYCIDHWSQRLGIDVLPLKYEIAELIRFRADARHFLEQLHLSGHEVHLVTNAHPDVVALKHARTGVCDLVRSVVSSHHLRRPKEHPAFWPVLQQQLDFMPGHTLFIDDSHAVLDAAVDFGIGHVVCASTPDSARPPRPHRHLVNLDTFPMPCGQRRGHARRR